MHTSAQPRAAFVPHTHDARRNYALRIEVSRVWWQFVRREISNVAALVELEILGLDRATAIRILDKPRRMRRAIQGSTT